MQWEVERGTATSDINFGDLMDVVDFENRYTYTGSLTIPPCERYVHWNVLSTIYPITEDNFMEYLRQMSRNKKLICFGLGVNDSLNFFGTTKGLDASPLISIETSPVETSFDLAPIITSTKSKTMPEKEITPKIKSKLIFIKKCLQMT